jgi:hypothetical protein
MTVEAGHLAALDQAVAAWREACRMFAYTPGTGEQLRAAEADLRRAGYDPATGLITLPIGAVHFTDVRADGARMAAVCGSILGGGSWVAWRGRCFRFGVDTQTYTDTDMIQIRS